MGDINKLIADGRLSDAASILYDSVYTIITSGSPRVNISRAEFDKVAPELIKKLQKPDVNPNEGDVINLKNCAPLIIKFVGPDRVKLPKDLNKKIIVGARYSFEAPIIDGFKAFPSFIEGVMTEEGAEVVVTYDDDVASHMLKITYKTPDGIACPDGYVESIKEGAAYDVASPVVEGCTPDAESVNGVMGTEDIEQVVTYTKNIVTHTLMVTYEGPNDEHFLVPDGVIEEVEVGASYSVTSPVVKGYAPNKDVVSGVMGKSDVDVTVKYTAVDAE